MILWWARLRQHDSVFAEHSRVQNTKRGARPERCRLVRQRLVADPVGIAGHLNSLSATQFTPDRRGKQVIQIFFEIEQV
jgi:hypothetical protein